MAKLDLNYITELVPLIREDDMNAFAEFYAATCHKQYAFAFDLLKDSFAAQTALEEAYISVLKKINRLRDDSLIISWLNQIMFRICIRDLWQTEHGRGSDPESQTVRIGGSEYTIRRVMTLPFTESQSLLLVYYCGMKRSAVADLLELSYPQLRHYLKNGILRLSSEPDGGTAL